MAYHLVESGFEFALRVKCPKKKMTTLRVIYLRNDRSRSRVRSRETMFTHMQISHVTHVTKGACRDDIAGRWIFELVLRCLVNGRDSKPVETDYSMEDDK